MLDSLDHGRFLDLPTCEQVYHTFVEGLPLLPKAQEKELIAQARSGDRAARDALLLSCQRYIRYRAGKFARLHYALTGNQRVEFLDLVQEANTACLKGFEQALAAEAPGGYLRAIIHHAMVSWCMRNASLVSNPAERERVVLVPVYSLDQPVPGQHDPACTFVDLLAAPAPEPAPATSPREYTALARALERLTPLQREAVIRYYGLQGRPQEALCEIAPHARSHLRYALRRLGALLLSPEEAAAPPERLGSALTPNEEMYTTDEVCARLGISRSALCRLVKRGKLTRCLTGYYAKQEVDVLAAQQPRLCRDELYTMQQACARLGISESLLCLLARAGTLSRPMTGYYLKCDVERLAAQRAQARSLKQSA